MPKYVFKSEKLGLVLIIAKNFYKAKKLFCLYTGGEIAKQEERVSAEEYKRTTRLHEIPILTKDMIHTR